MASTPTLKEVLAAADPQTGRPARIALNPERMPMPLPSVQLDDLVKITPPHYDKAVQPWDLEECMDSTGNAFVDARLCDVIEYVFRNKESRIEDLEKAQDCLAAAIRKLKQLQA